MVALKTAEIEPFLARPHAERPVVLVCGPDAGLVRERVLRLVKASVDDPNDPFALVRVEGDLLASEPSRLYEEASTVPLFGGRRAVLIRAGTRNFAAALDPVLADPPPDCRIVIEAGDLRKSAPLRAACERSKAAAVLVCYVDTERDLVRLVDDEMREAGLAIAPEARAALVSLIGGDRAASRSEIRKLALYAHGHGTATLDDVLAVVADASALALDALIDAVFAGRPAEVETQFAKARAAGTAPGTILSAALRFVGQMHKARAMLDAGEYQDAAMRAFIPAVHFRRDAQVKAALTRWTAPRLARVMEQWAEATFNARKAPALAEAMAQRALLSVAQGARRGA